jgi:hypothetical protein
VLIKAQRGGTSKEARPAPQADNRPLLLEHRCELIVKLSEYKRCDMQGAREVRRLTEDVLRISMISRTWWCLSRFGVTRPLEDGVSFLAHETGRHVKPFLIPR